MSLARALLPALLAGHWHHRRGKCPRLGDLLRPLGAHGMALTAVLVALPFIWPFSLGPLTLGASAVLFYVGWGLIRGREHLELPQRLLDFPIPLKVFRVVRRGVALLSRWRHGKPAAAERVAAHDRISPAGWSIMVGAALLAVPIPFLPLTNTFPALGVILSAKFLLTGQRSTLWLAYACYIAGLMVFGALGWVAWRATLA